MVQVSRKTKLIFLIFISVLAVALVAVVAFLAARNDSMTNRGPTEPQPSAQTGTDSNEPPRLTTEVVAEGLNHPWDVAFLPGGTMLVNERSGKLSARINGELQTLRQIKDVYDQGEGGLLGLAVDSEFADNRYIYTCYSSTHEDVRVVRWRLDKNNQNLSDKTPIVTGMPLNPSGRHSGCRVRMDAGNILWVGTGDAAIGTNPQDPNSLGGKILRVTRDGEPAEGNLQPPFDPRIFSYGHRNTQGLALYETPQGESAGFSVEHGSSVDDEVNPLVPGNFGWNPVPFYNESVPMTDLEQYPDAIQAVWRSGNPTIAPSGATFITGDQWQAYEGMLAIAVLKGQHLRLQQYDDNGTLLEDKALLKDAFGRLRSVVQGPDGALYVTTDNGGGNDKIFTVRPE